MEAYQQDQARDAHGRWTSGGIGPSQRRAEVVALNRRLDARNRSRTFDFGPAARAVENKPAHMAGIESATAGKTLARGSAMGATTAQVRGNK